MLVFAAALKLTVLEGGSVRESRIQFFDLMGSERFIGQNAAHDSSQSSKSTQGWLGRGLCQPVPERADERG